ncbi:MAG: BON domain-containing protein [Acidobacteria bacterium]|nr:BON domain-containing protein [Acidobacteriota bacterium]
MRIKLSAIVAATALLALAAGCSSEVANNANVNVANRNTAVVVNNNANMAVNANTNAAARNDNWNYNTKREDFDKNANGWRSSATGLGDKISTEASDAWIHFKARGALAGVDDLRDSTINVDVEKGVVTLRGSVDNAAHKAAAEKAAKVDGATKVVNSLTIKPSGDANKNANANAKKG